MQFRGSHHKSIVESNFLAPQLTPDSQKAGTLFENYVVAMKVDYNIIRHLFDTINRTGIEYCILTGYKSLLEKNHFDLDIIIAPKDLMTIERSLYAGRNWKLVQMFQQETSCYNFILAVQVEDRLTYIHLNTRVDYRRDGRLYFTARELLAGRQLWNGFWLAAAEG